MNQWGRVLVSFVAAGALAFPVPVFSAQDKPPQQSEKDRKKKEKERYKELDSAYKNWLDNEIPYIITEEERSAFLQLSTNEEREQFIEQFWLNRDPTPDTIENEVKEEHYRRIAYANERFASGVPGWKTDRGRIYIIWGHPDEIESHPTGGSYDRPPEEGGGFTSTFPFEKWRYRYLEGIGNDIILEFVDKTGSGEYRMTMDPSEKDALLHVPGAGLSDAEAMGLASKTDRFTRTDGTYLPKTLGAEPMRMNQFERLRLFAEVQRPPARYRDLEELVTSRILRNQIRFDYRFDFLRVTSDTVLVPITVQIPNRQLTFQNKEGVHSAGLNLYGRITTIGGRIVQVFEDSITRDIPESLLEQSLGGFSIYQKAIPLRPGLYRLDLVIKDVNSGNVGTDNKRLPVPRYADDKLASSTLILADLIERVSRGEIGTGPFVLGASKVRPKLDQTFLDNEKMGIYFQVYNLAIDASTHKASASVNYIIRKGDEEVLRLHESSAELEHTGEQLTIEKKLSLAGLPAGRYTLEIQVTDNVNQQSLSSSAEFTVKSAPAPKVARN